MIGLDSLQRPDRAVLGQQVEAVGGDQKPSAALGGKGTADMAADVVGGPPPTVGIVDVDPTGEDVDPGELPAAGIPLWALAENGARIVEELSVQLASGHR